MAQVGLRVPTPRAEEVLSVRLRVSSPGSRRLHCTGSEAHFALLFLCVCGKCVCVLVGSTLGAAGPNWKQFLRGPRFTAKVCRIVEI